MNANWSHEFRKMLGYHDTLDFPNKLESWSDLLHPQDKERVMVQLQAAIKDKTNQIKYQVEYRMRMKDNQYQWFRASAEVETAENRKIAVEKVEASPKDLYDLVFMDIQMPVMNGYEATAAIRSLPGEQGKLPIVAMTANAFAEDVQLAKNTGMNGHIAKPLDMNKLNDVLESWL